MPSTAGLTHRQETCSPELQHTETRVEQVRRHSSQNDSSDYKDGYQDDETYDDNDDDSGSSVLSVPDANIDFDLVYALHSFNATVEGQATVAKGDALTLLDDSNSYWWLVNVIQTSEIGYIPAENIETPFERLARLNAHRNTELTADDLQSNLPASQVVRSGGRKKVKLANGVKYQSHIVFGDSDDEDYEEAFEEWQEIIRTNSDTDSDESDETEDDSDDSSDDSEENAYSSIYHNINYSRVTQHHPNYVEQQHKSTGNTDTVHMATNESDASPRSISKRSDFDLESPEPERAVLTPPIISEDDIYDEYLSADEPQGDTLELILASMDDEDKQLLARNQHEQHQHTDHHQQLDQYKQVDQYQKIEYHQQEERHQYEVKEMDEAESRRLSFQKSKDKKQRKSSSEKRSSTDDASETASINSLSTSGSRRSNSIDYGMRHHREDQDQKPTILKIYAADDRFGAEFKYAYVYPHTTAAELVQQMLDTFEIEESVSDGDLNAHLDYFLVVKGVDGDEYTLVPLDHPLAIYSSLTTHLTTPMPSLKKARRISALMAMNGSIHMGGPKRAAEEQEEVRFYLHAKQRRNDDHMGVIPIKVALSASDSQNVPDSSGRDSLREYKLVHVAPHALVYHVTKHLISKFHLNGLADGPRLEERIQAQRLQHSESDSAVYSLYVCIQGKVYSLLPLDPVSSAFRDALPPVSYRETRHQDRSSISSVTSLHNPPQAGETYFILQRKDRQPSNDAIKAGLSTSKALPHRPVRQNTRMVRQGRRETGNSDRVHHRRSVALADTQPSNHTDIADSSKAAVTHELDSISNQQGPVHNNNESFERDMNNHTTLDNAVTQPSSPHILPVSVANAPFDDKLQDNPLEPNQHSVQTHNESLTKSHQHYSDANLDHEPLSQQQHLQYGDSISSESHSSIQRTQDEDNVHLHQQDRSMAFATSSVQDQHSENTILQKNEDPETRYSVQDYPASHSSSPYSQRSSRHLESSHFDIQEHHKPAQLYFQEPASLLQEMKEDTQLENHKNQIQTTNSNSNTLQSSQTRQSTVLESLLLDSDDYVKDMMVLIRSVGHKAEKEVNNDSQQQPSIHSAIGDVLKDTCGELDLLDKALDRLMADAMATYDF